MLAVRAGVPVVPVFISGTGRALGKGRRLPRPVKVRVTFGPPLVLEGPVEGRKEYYEVASRQMMAAIARLRAIHLQMSPMRGEHSPYSCAICRSHRRTSSA